MHFLQKKSVCMTLYISKHNLTLPFKERLARQKIRLLPNWKKMEVKNYWICVIFALFISWSEFGQYCTALLNRSLKRP